MTPLNLKKAEEGAADKKKRRRALPTEHQLFDTAIVDPFYVHMVVLNVFEHYHANFKVF